MPHLPRKHPDFCGKLGDPFNFPVIFNLYLNIAISKVCYNKIIIAGSLSILNCLSLKRTLFVLPLYQHLAEWLDDVWEYSWPLNNKALNCVGPLIRKHFSINTANAFLFLTIFSIIFFSLAYLYWRMKYIIHIIHKICVDWLFMFSEGSGQQ